MISLCITTWNRVDMVIKAFERVLDDDRISEIVIVDDHSDSNSYDLLKSKLETLNDKKIKLYRNDINLDCYRNKREAISRATNEWCIILDSDNVIDVSYIDSLFCHAPWYKHIIYSPEFARPHFDFREMTGNVISRECVHLFVDVKPFHWLINAMNYFVNRSEYLSVWDGSIDPHTADTIFQNYNWISAGNSIFVVQGMQYDHLVHSGSHYKNNVRKTGTLFEDLMKKLKTIR